MYCKRVLRKEAEDVNSEDVVDVGLGLVDIAS